MTRTPPPTQPAPAATEATKAPKRGGSKATAGAAAAGASAPAGGEPPATQPDTARQPPATPALDLASLEQRLRDTHAIGVFTKLSLKNQVDDLVMAFRAFHNKQAGKTLAQLRQQYEGLLLKVLSLLQDGDPSLASAISASREAIWGILTDPQKFSKI